MTKLFCIQPVVVVTEINTCVKIHRTVSTLYVNLKITFESLIIIDIYSSEIISENPKN